MSGTGTVRCEECQDVLDITCKHPHTNTSGGPFVEFAYCTTCEILYKRKREPVIDAVNYQYDQYRTDEKEEYVCSSCKQRHPFTVSEDDSKSFVRLENPKIVSHETVTLSCLCGGQLGINGEAIPSRLDCSNCSRVYEMTVLRQQEEENS
jgi:hypothetical protein